MPTLNRGPASRGSAEIIAFPARGRFAVALQDDFVDARASTGVVKTVSGSSWYHEEAIRNERTTKN
jgi:hypothetical protein